MLSAELDYQSIFKELNRQNIDYIVVGGLAVNFHGVPRMTYDIDLMILLDSQNIRNTLSVLSGWGYRARAPVDPGDLIDEEKRAAYIREKHMKAFSFYHDTQAIGEIDLVIDTPLPYEEMKMRAVKVNLGGVQIPVVSKKDLIKLKRRSGRKQDLSDVESLEKIWEK